jgi:serine/threonine-protein kinase
LAPELLSQSASRLRILALLYAFTFFMAGVFPNLVIAEWRAPYWGNPENWVPALISIAVGLAVAALAASPRLPLSTVMRIGLAFEVVSCYGIALAEYLEPTRLNLNGWIGLSWIAAWAPLFTVVIPTRPVTAALVTFASLTSAPIVIGFMILTERTTFRPGADRFFFWSVLPYLLITIMSYVGARVVYTLGKAVTEARELGSYRLVERLGQGGMGEVWRAKHRLLARPAAIKLIRASTGSGTAAQEDAVRRFEREAQVTAGLSSPHTVQLFDFGVADDGSFYYVMELLNGLDLERLVQRYGPIPAERAIYLLRQVCHSLGEAESYGLVHRDIKPANLFVCRYGGEYDFVKVLDFGIAKAIPDMMQTGAFGLTLDNMLQGTPAYIAPEQVMNGAGVDSRADIYATGCVAYFLLTGQPVFTGDTPMAVVVKHANSAPPRPSDGSELPIPPALDQLILDCLAKNPDDRPQTARELSRRLAEVDGATSWTEDRARDWWEKHQPTERIRPSGLPEPA